MKTNQTVNNLWTRFDLDGQMRVVAVVNADERLFFGKTPVCGKTLAASAGQDHCGQADIITSGILRAQQEKRNTCFEYLSAYSDTESTHVCVHVEYLKEAGVALYLTALDTNDFRRTHQQTEQTANTMLQAIYDNMPVGMEVYDRTGRLMEINNYELRTMGIRNKEEVLGVNIFENPNLSPEMRLRFLAGENMHFTTEYDCSKVKDYYKTSRKDVIYLDISVGVMRDATGEIDKYLVISQDITSRVVLEKKYEDLYRQNMELLDSLPVGVGLYKQDGALLYANKIMYPMFGTTPEVVWADPLNIFENPKLPEVFKEAVRDARPVHICFPYEPETGSGPDSSDSAGKRIRQIDCNGQPIYNRAGEVDYYVFIVNDVTKETQIKERLRESHRKKELALLTSDIMIWEFDVRERLFYSDNEPMNGYDNTRPLTIADYAGSVHPGERGMIMEVIERMCSGEDFAFHRDARISFPNESEWQYCAISGSPYKRDGQGRVLRYVGTRKNNTELQRKRLLQEKILDSIPLSIHIKDIENHFKYVFCNEESKRMFGTSEEGTIYDVLGEEEVERIQRTDLEVFKTGKPYFGQEHIELKDGRSYDTIVRKSIIHDNGKRLLLNIRWDQSLQNDLQRRSKILSITMETMGAYMWFYEPDKNKVRFGEGFEKNCKDPSQVDSLETFAACIHPDDRPRFVNDIQRLLASENDEWHIEYRADLNDEGIYEWWETSGIVETSILNDAPYKYIFGMTISIEAHKQTELTLLKNKAELKQLVQQNELVLDNTNSGLAYITPDYIVQWENVSKCSNSISHEAYKQGELCYKSAHNRTTPCENCVLVRAMQSLQMEQIKFRLNNDRMVEVFATPVFRENGVVDGIVIRMDDVTGREQMIEELRQAKMLAEQSDKLKSAFLANMSHEIRTPLNAIVGFSELLMDSSGEEKEEYMQIINNNNELLLKLINDILDLSKIEAGSVELKCEEFDLSEYFDGMAVSMKQRIKNPNVRMVAVNPYTGCRVNLDRNRIAQILTNYVTNAIKYTPKGFIEMGYECRGEGIYLYVKDSGIGIPDEKKDKVFHRFEKLDEFAQGTGLGLSICKAIAESMGGTVGFESRYGEGSLFWARIPCLPEIETDGEMPEKEPVDMTTVADSQEGSISPGRKIVLVAEDMPGNYLLVSAMLHKHCDLIHALNGKQAVELVRSRPVDVLLMDMKMPVMDGLTATAEIRKFDQKLPIIALTAHAFESDRLAALAAGCNEYLVKPINKDRLMSVLQRYFPVSEESSR